MESSHANHRVPVILNDEYVSPGVEPNALLIFKLQRHLMTVDASIICKSAIGLCSIPSLGSGAATGYTAANLPQFQSSDFHVFFVSALKNLPRPVNSDTVIQALVLKARPRPFDQYSNCDSRRNT